MSTTTKFKRLVVTGLATSAAAVGFGAMSAAPASAYNYAFCGNVLLQAGGSGIQNDTCRSQAQVHINSVTGHALSNAKTCAQLYQTGTSTIYDQKCTESLNDYITYDVPSPKPSAQAGVHNHSPHQGRFNGGMDLP